MTNVSRETPRPTPNDILVAYLIKQNTTTLGALLQQARAANDEPATNMILEILESREIYNDDPDSQGPFWGDDEWPE